MQQCGVRPQMPRARFFTESRSFAGCSRPDLVPPDCGTQRVLVNRLR